MAEEIRLHVDGGEVIAASVTRGESSEQAIRRVLGKRLVTEVLELVAVATTGAKILYSAKLATGRAYDVLVAHGD